MRGAPNALPHSARPPRFVPTHVSEPAGQALASPRTCACALGAPSRRPAPSCEPPSGRRACQFGHRDVDLMLSTLNRIARNQRPCIFNLHWPLQIAPRVQTHSSMGRGRLELAETHD
ncbi:hypothetical protein GY45DRAFT_1037424 [Cubamyces sp. BRFM 1775]|nr:hypothetical protein GY45DRAFT_1037424 [Cubamyces sp. BRFM 1775]